MKRIYTLAVAALSCFAANAQVAFTNANNRLVNSDFHSGCSIAVVDWNGDGLDDIVRLDQGHDLYVEIQNGTGLFESRFFGAMGTSSAWGMAVADVDHNGFKDVLTGGGTCRLMMMSDDGLTGNIVTLPNGTFFMQNANFADINNDGWLDLFACDDNAQSHIWLNDGTGAFPVESDIIDFDITPTDDSGNYGSVWTDFDNDGDIDLYIAKCRQSVNNPTDGRRINVLFENNGDGTYTSNAAEYNIAIGWQTWTSNFADIDNDGDLDLLVTNHDFESQIWENDGTGHYTDITATTGFNVSDITPIESVLEDFDNDGWVDILITGSASRFFKNNGDKTFTKITGLFDNDDIESFAIGDLDHDGFIDVYGGYANIYTNPTSIDDVLWLNEGNANHFFNLVLEGTVSNLDAVGARAFIYGPWGMQLRENHCGESYGTVNTFHLHFGLGESTQIDSVVIKWPSGITQTILNPVVDQFLTVIENDCVSPEAIVTANGPLAICDGESVELETPAGYSYLWNNGETTQAITISTSGEYYVAVTAPGNNCTSISAAVTLLANPDETPTIAASGITAFCEGGSITLDAPYGYSAYLWSNGSTDQDITVTEAGTYTLAATGLCATFTSNEIEVNVLNPDMPAAENDTVLAPGASVTLTATGDNVQWYDAPVGGTLLYSGNAFTTPVLTSTTMYYVQNNEVFGGEVAVGGLGAPSGGNQFPGNNTNAKVYIDVYENCTLLSSKVYTDYAGYRLFEMYTNGGILYDTALVYVNVDSTIVMLNMDLEPGSYYLTTDATVNAQIPGWSGTGPRLKRNPSGTGVAYPYTIGDMLAITGNDQSGSFYYNFYDVTVKDESVVCESERVPVEVFYDTDISVNNLASNSISVFPNPAFNSLNVVMSINGEYTIALVDALGRTVFEQTASGASAVIDVASLASGVYNLAVGNNGLVENVKVVLQK
ncbi:MAG TPA: FG-GAP-like repeat-containing protein [Chitinophagales bacterium]|nr:FG-GAP-like repeat-containing protein [Chitinophagales bacterium]